MSTKPGLYIITVWLFNIQPISFNSLLTLASRFTHRGRYKMAAISQTTVSNAFPWMKMFGFRLKFHWSVFPRAQLTIFRHWFREWLGVVQATSHYLNQWWLVYRRLYASLGLNELTWMVIMTDIWHWCIIIHIELCYVIVHPCHNFNGGLINLRNC